MTALTLPVPLIGIDLGGVLPSDLLTVPLSQIVRLLPADASPLSTVQVSLSRRTNKTIPFENK